MKITVLSGAGISEESGISTFRGSGGLWNNYRIEEVATPTAWQANPSLVLSFYNARRAQLEVVSPNHGHVAIASLDQKHEVQVVTQNVDDLHERAGSKNILHLHGELVKVRSTINSDDIYNIGYEPIEIGDLCRNQHQLRPHIVWFGEDVPLIETAAEMVMQSELLIVIGTSLNVYPAAGLLHYAPSNTPIYLIDPNPVDHPFSNVEQIELKASEGVQTLINQLDLL